MLFNANCEWKWMDGKKSFGHEEGKETIRQRNSDRRKKKIENVQSQEIKKKSKTKKFKQTKIDGKLPRKEKKERIGERDLNRRKKQIEKLNGHDKGKKKRIRHKRPADGRSKQMEK